MSNDLHGLIHETLDLSKQLILCLDRENACLIARDYDQLMDIAANKQQLLEQLERLDEARQSQVADADFNDYLKTRGTTRLDSLWQALKTNIQQCARKNEVNGRLLQRQNRLTRETMELLTGRNISQAATYDAKGMTSAQDSLLPNIEA